MSINTTAHDDTNADETEFEGLRKNRDLTIRRDEHILLGRKRETIEILHRLLKNDWVEAGGLAGFEGLTLKLDAVVYEEAAIAYSIGRDFRVKRVSVEDDGKLKIEIEILEWESNPKF